MSVQEPKGEMSSFDVIHRLSSVCDFELEDRQKVQNPRLTPDQRKKILEMLEESQE